MVQLWGEGMTDPEVGELGRRASSSGCARRSSGTSRCWHPARRTAPRPTRPTLLAVEQVPLLIAAVQGYVLQRRSLDDFDGEAYLAAVEKYLPR